MTSFLLVELLLGRLGLGAVLLAPRRDLARLLEAAVDVLLQLAEGGGLEGLKVDLDGVGVGLPKGRLTGLKQLKIMNKVT